MTYTPRDWTKAEEDQLRQLRADGVTYPEIGKIMKRSASSVQGKGGNLGLNEDYRDHSAGAHREAQALIPKVDRSKMTLTARFFGDPPPGRSALATRQAQ